MRKLVHRSSKPGRTKFNLSEHFKRFNYPFRFFQHTRENPFYQFISISRSFSSFSGHRNMKLIWISKWAFQTLLFLKLTGSYYVELWDPEAGMIQLCLPPLEKEQQKLWYRVRDGVLDIQTPQAELNATIGMNIKIYIVSFMNSFFGGNSFRHNRATSFQKA